ncbi:aspartic peptidase domain-containing protein [Apiosordaria backusii]|uniref:Aspartic peptidase domain-containing protein n=1 Tax=Apiosordaria backusii TaxID=314023 RepID=A0AA40BE95_9PEZI|nr:aspartic peptidase domain-containing protein [Apiosordaria backusii]
MLRPTSFLTQLTLWVAAANAFVLFVPDDQCDPSGHCGSFTKTTRKHAGHSTRSDEVVSFPLVARPREVLDDESESNVDRVALAIARVAQKFGTRPAVRTVSDKDDKDYIPGNQYTISTPITPTTEGSTGIYQYGPDFSYFIKIKLGSQQTALYMLLDTGAANTWVMGTDCLEYACRLHDRFNRTASTSWKPEGGELEIYYGTGTVTGVIGKDKMVLAGKTVEVPVGVANHTAEELRHYAFDGILGLAMSNSVTGTFMHEIRLQNAFKPIVAVSMNRDSDGVNDGQVTFGGVDPAKYVGEIAYSNVPDVEKKNGEWTIPLDGFSFDGKKADISTRKAVIDTGTTYIFASPLDVAALFKLVPGSSSEEKSGYFEYTVPCETKTAFKITFAGVSYEIPAKDWIAQVEDKKCLSRIYGYPDLAEFRPGVWVMGDVFLKNVYSVFDGDNNNMRIGFAAKAAAPKPTSTSSNGAVATGEDGRPIMPGSHTSGSATVEITSPETTSPQTVSGGSKLGGITFTLAWALVAWAVMAV